MVRLNKEATVGEIFVRRDGKKCIFVSKDEDERIYMYRFRLLEEHEMLVEKYKKYRKNGANIGENAEYRHRIWHGLDIWDNYAYEGDWYVKFNGSATQCSKWETNHDIMSKCEE